MKYLLKNDGSLVKGIIVHSIPNGFSDISEGLEIDENAVGLGVEFLEAVLVEEVPAIEAVVEHWTDGTDIVYDVNDIPTLTDADGNPYLDPTYVHVAAVQAVDAIPAHYRIKKTTDADQQLRQAKMDQLSALRAPLLAEADIQINKLEDNGGDSAPWRTYRQALRDITETYKKVNGEWKVIVDSLIVEEFVFPAKPQ